jgi:Putative beta-barrel porin-2, OmpL-like. bbp2
MNLKVIRILKAAAVTAMAAGLVAVAQAPDPSSSSAVASAAAQAPAAPAAQAPAAAPAAAPTPPAPLSTFVLTGPLVWLPPATFDAGPLGTLSVNGIITGYSLFQNNSVPGDTSAQATMTNGQIFIQKADGPVQFYVQAGVYDLPTIGVPFVNAQNTVSNLYGPVPVAFLKIPAGKTTQFLIGSLPTLMGAESTFTYQNFNIERGIVWNQENAINRGIQINQGLGKYFSASVSWNDGYYSDRYTWLSGSITYTKGANTLVYDGMGNLGQTGYETAATPVQNNGYMHAVIYTYAKGPWIISPYFQYGNLPTNLHVGIAKATSAIGGAFNLSYAFKDGFSLPLRVEYLTSSGNATDGSVNLLGYGPGSAGTTFTVTPTYQKGGMYIRGDIGFVDATNYTSGDVFGQTGTDANQFRGVLEFGFIFGNNIEK